MAGPRNEGEELAISGLRMAEKYNPGGAEEACDRYLGEDGNRRYGNASTSLAKEISDNPKGFEDIQGMCRKQFVGATEPSLVNRVTEYLLGSDTKPGTGPGAHTPEKKDPGVGDYINKAAETTNRAVDGTRKFVTGDPDKKLRNLGI